jgi:hypothetical protein
MVEADCNIAPSKQIENTDNDEYYHSSCASTDFADKLAGILDKCLIVTQWTKH